jgi:4'-phosphopantetheinyl transferase
MVMVTENCTMITDIEWEKFSDNMILEKDKTYVIKVATVQYYDLISNDYLNVLSPYEIQRSLRFKQDKDKRRFIAGRHLLRTVLSKIVQVDKREIEFSYSEFNKPLFKNIDFNLSHSGEYILVATGLGAIGIDVEYMKPGFEYEPVLGICFGPEEISYIKSSDNESLSFYTFWTRKEAVLKATGEGLIDNLPEINCVDDVVYREKTQYQLVSFMVDNSHMGSLAANNLNNINYINMQVI